MHLLILTLCALALGAESAAVKGRYTPNESQQRPFYGDKSRIPESDGALPALLSPPPAPSAEPGGDEGPQGPPMPYSFSYTADGHDGRSAREETSDGKTVTGSYMLEGPDGISRIVHYIADENGFRATVMTNEPGTESQNPSAIIMNSSQPPAEEIALKYGAGEPNRAPQGQFRAPIRQSSPQYIGASAEQSPAIDDYNQQAAAAPLLAPIRDETPQYAQPQILAPSRPQSPSKQNFGFRTQVQHSRAQPVKGYAPEPQRKVFAPQRPAYVAPRPQIRAPAKKPIEQTQYRPLPMARPLALPPPPPAPRPLAPPLRSKQTAFKNPRPFFIPTTQAPAYFEDQQQQKQEEVFDEPQQVQEQEPEPAQQQIYDEPQQQQQNVFRSS